MIQKGNNYKRVNDADADADVDDYNDNDDDDDDGFDVGRKWIIATFCDNLLKLEQILNESSRVESRRATFIDVFFNDFRCDERAGGGRFFLIHSQSVKSSISKFE